MDESSGWVKLYRQTLDNPIVCKDTETFAVWCYLLLMAAHKQRKVLFNNGVVELDEGQLITGRKTISEKFYISESKVQRILKLLESEHQIEQQTSSKNRLISIVNWHKYQASEHQSEQQVNNERTTSEQQVNTYKNIRIKELENIEANYTAIQPPKAPHGFDLFWQAYPKKVGKLDAMRAFAKVSVSAETLIAAVERQKRSAQWNRDNGQYIPNPATWLNQGRWEDEPDGRDTGKVFRQLPAIDC